MHFGSLFVTCGLPLARFWRPFGSNGPTLGALCLTLAHFWQHLRRINYFFFILLFGYGVIGGPTTQCNFGTVFLLLLSSLSSVSSLSSSAIVSLQSSTKLVALSSLLWLLLVSPCVLSLARIVQLIPVMQFPCDETSFTDLFRRRLRRHITMNI